MKKLANHLYWFLIAGALFYYLYHKGYIFANFENITPQETYQMLQHERNVTLLDVRTKREKREDGYIEGAKLIPVEELEKRIDELSPYKKRKLIVYCRSGHRSVTASRILANAGYRTYNVKGGINAWKKEGLPLASY
ncbi:MAG: hypothetical protein B6D59_04575 [Campylobacteraceae bacterium 4484_4]|nr:MAG: hypothetical protein B6D59_04575 [Campylobacteraceae bacterium 4484_4]